MDSPVRSKEKNNREIRSPLSAKGEDRGRERRREKEKRGKEKEKEKEEEIKIPGNNGVKKFFSEWLGPKLVRKFNADFAVHEQLKNSRWNYPKISSSFFFGSVKLRDQWALEQTSSRQYL